MAQAAKGHFVPEIRKEPPTLATLHEYGHVTSSFLVESRLRAEALRNGLDGWRLIEEIVKNPWVKDYDGPDGEGTPARWAVDFDISRWGVISVFEGTARIGGAIVARNAPGISVMEASPTLAVLWDMRISPESRRSGVGSLLFPHVSEWAKSRGCTHMVIETQDINVPACKFYARMGCELRAIHPDAYANLPDETQLLWYRRL